MIINFCEKAQKIIAVAESIAFDFGHSSVGSEHLLLSFLKVKDTKVKKLLENQAHLANFCIGQGDLLLSPVSMLTLYSAISTDGKYYTPSVVEGILNENGTTEYDIGKKTKAIEPETAKILREYLASVITEGTGEDAQPKTVTAAGKTATAQTGKFQNRKEIYASWFCGFFPKENPQYTVIVFSENSLKQTKSCAEIFADIADNITTLNKK